MVTVRQLLEDKGHTIHSLGPEEPVRAAIELMARHYIGAMLVMQGESLVGIVSERDYARKVVLLGRSSSETPVWQIMTSPVITVTPEQTVDECMRIVTARRVRHLPVLDRGQVIGVVSIGDLVKAVIEMQRQDIDQLQRYIAS